MGLPARGGPGLGSVGCGQDKPMHESVDQLVARPRSRARDARCGGKKGQEAEAEAEAEAGGGGAVWRRRQAEGE